MSTVTRFIKQMLRRVRGGGTQEFRLINPVREWVIGLSIAGVLLLAGGYYTGSLFLEEISKDVFDVRAEGVETTIYKRGLIRDVLERYDARAEAFGGLRTTSAPPPPVSQDTDEDDTSSDDVIAPAQ